MIGLKRQKSVLRIQISAPDVSLPFRLVYIMVVVARFETCFGSQNSYIKVLTGRAIPRPEKGGGAGGATTMLDISLSDQLSNVKLSS